MTDLALLGYQVAVAALEGDRDTLAEHLASTPVIQTAATCELAVMTLASVVTSLLTPEQLADVTDQIRGFASERQQFNTIVSTLEGDQP
ncbi:hypothetical protein ACFWZY_16955 [Streptomyces sp. NPDC058992]|uniref:hypothetical protein n=1 Tax=Streptomyces sp. NPDC058992 TaxID=3346688 RepID=UPI00367EB43F